MLTVLPTGRSLLDAYQARGAAPGAYSAEFLAALALAGAWSTAARQVLALAEALHVELDEERLKLSDVHDLQALRAALMECACGSRRAS